ncbi:MAG: DUF389 domain-containing protein [Crocinitomicaceae bacterium]|nr:DUF389 domain-containing protein [Crocinitomicaceae bacterium]
MKEKNWITSILNFLQLTHEQEENEIIQETIEKAVVFRGTNLWILVFAILIASVGLNMNSTAVIIGAMLISPLMGPINGIGYSVATYNYPLFWKSLKNFGFSTSAALVTSTLYFALTPIHTEHSEILARTSPTIYDVLIALFGGLAGIVALSSKNKGNVIPGVAIATALMPPLCAAGYGVSIGNWGYFAGALYLFVINSVFIALSAMIVSQLLKLPKQTHLLSREIKNKNLAVIILIFLTVVPSFYFGITLVKKEKFVATAQEFVQGVSVWDGNYLLSSNIDGDLREISLIYAGNEFDDQSEEKLYEKAQDLGLEDFTIDVEQGLKINDLEGIKKSNDELSQIQGEVHRLQSTLIFREHSLDSLMAIPNLGESLLSEIQPLFPTINGCSYAVSERYVDSLKTSSPVSLIYFEVDEELEQEDKMKIKEWLKRRLKTTDLILKF